MFVELMPLLASRSVLITAARQDEKTIRLCVIPKQTKPEENPALTTPLTFVGTPEELDRELGKQVASYVECHTQLGSTLAQAKAEMEAAAKAAQEEAKRKADERRKAKSSAPAPATPVTTPPAASASADVAQPATSSLFGATPAEPAQSQNQGGLAL